MNSTQQNTLSIGIATGLFLITACGAGTRQETTDVSRGPLDKNLLGLVPDGADAVLWTDLAELRSSVLWPAVVQIWQGEPLTAVWGNSESSPLNTGDELLLIYDEVEGEDNDQVLLLVKGRFASEQLIRSYLESPAATDAPGVPFEIDGFSGLKTDRFVVLALTEHTLALGTEPLLSGLIRQVVEQGGPGSGAAEFSDMSLDGSVAASLRYRSDSPTPGGSSGMLPSNVLGIDSRGVGAVDARLIIDGGIQIRVEGGMGSPDEAGRMAKDLARKQRELRRNLFVVFLGIDWLVDRISVSTQGTSVRIDVALSGNDIQELERFTERLDKIQELTQGKMESMLPGAEEEKGN